MATTFIPGYAASITIDSVDLTVYGNVLDMSASKGTPRKPVFGKQTQGVISGQIAWTIACSGHVAKEGPVGPLLASFAKTTPLTIAIQMGELNGATDGGAFAGNGIWSALTVNADAEGEWEWSGTIEVDGDLTYTAPTPPGAAAASSKG